MLIPVAAGVLLLLGFCLGRRLHGKTRKQGDVPVSPNPEASAQDAVDSAEADAEPWPELAVGSLPFDSPLTPMPRRRFQQDRTKKTQLSARVPRPVRLPYAGVRGARGWLSPAAAREVAYGRDRARAPAGLKAGPQAGPATSNRSANGLENPQPAEPRARPSTLPAPTDRFTPRGTREGKLTEVVEAAPINKAARSCRARASIKAAEAELDKMHAGAKGTKDGPGLLTSKGTRQPRPLTRQVGADDLFAAVRARTEAIRAADGHTDGEPSTGLTKAPHGSAPRERESSGRHPTGNPPQRRLSKESWQRSERIHRGLSSAGGTIVRV